MVPTKPEPDDFEGNWPEKMGSVCRNDDAFSDVFEDCYICEFIVDGKKVRKASSRVWALACFREEVIGDGSEELGGSEMKGKVLGIRDKTRDVVIPAQKDENGKEIREQREITEKAVVVVNLGWRNFFSILQGFAGHFGTILDRDYQVKRVGAMTDTVYQCVPLDPLDIKKADGTVTRLDLRDPEFMQRYETSLVLDDIINGRASDDYYARFFDPRITVSGDGKVEQTGASPEDKPDSDMTQERMEALAQRVKGYQVPEDESSDDGAAAEEEEEKSSEPVVSSGGMRDFG